MFFRFFCCADLKLHQVKRTADCYYRWDFCRMSVLGFCLIAKKFMNYTWHQINGAIYGTFEEYQIFSI